MPKKVTLGVCTLSEVDSQAYPSHLIHAFRIGRDTDLDFNLVTPRRMTIATGRNMVVQSALETGSDYVYFFDDDMDMGRHTFSKLLARLENDEADIVMAMCHIRGYPFHPMVFRWLEDDSKDTRIGDVTERGKAIGLWQDCTDHISPNGLIENVAAVGCAATLIKAEVFKEMRYPWFYTGTANTEDVYFCVKAQQTYENLRIAVDTTCPVGHILKDRQVLYPGNAELLRKQYNEAQDQIREQMESVRKPAIEGVADGSDNNGARPVCVE